NPDIRYSIDNDMKNLTKETETNGNKLHNDTDEGGEKLNNNRSFESEYDKWAKGGGNKRITLTVCNTPAVLKKIGFKNQVITWDATKIAKIKSKHKGMTDDIIKQVPDILEKPIIIMKSTQKDSRITMLGEIYDLNNKPVLVVLELEPYSNTGVGLDEIKIASSYGKDRVQSFINKSEVLYLEPNKKRRNSWLAQNRLQLPLEQAKNTSNNTNISQDTTGVNNIISNKQDIDTKNLTMREQLEKWENGKMEPTEVFKLGITPSIFEKLGAKELPVIMTQKVMKKVTEEKHSVSTENIDQLYDSIADPIMIFTSKSVPNAYVILTELKDTNGKPIITALHLNKKSNRVDVNRVASVYGKDNVNNFIVTQIESDNLKYVDNKKSQSWLTSRGLILPKLVQDKIDSLGLKNTHPNNTNISQDTTGVNNIISNKQDIDTKNKHSVADGENDYSKNIEKYGAIPKGENPIRAVKVPKRTSKTNAVSYFARTMLEAESTPDTAISEFEKKIMGGNMVHEVITDKSAKEYALRF
ncbi:MAG: hypothetical protein RR957_01275, partial [Oscillospiraceae bacterium]